MKDLLIYTDGGCRPSNPGPGGWAYAIAIDGETDLSAVTTDNGKSLWTTNNIMEMTATLRAFDWILTNNVPLNSVIIRPDSKYVLDGVTKYMENQKKKGWKNSDGKPTKNVELWKEMYEKWYKVQKLVKSIKFVWVKGHSGDP